MIDGVAINLKALLRGLEKRGISHSSEKSIRKELRAHSQVQTHSHHRFLPTSHPTSADVTSIQKADLMAQLGSICMPREELPSEFTAYLMEQGGNNYVLLLYCSLN